MNRKLYSLLIMALISCPALPADSLHVHLRQGQLYVTSPGMRILTGRVLERLHDGVTVQFVYSLTAAFPDNGKVISQATGRFAVSFDLWEERFSVEEINGLGRSASHLSASAAEAWCLENISLSTNPLAGARLFLLKLDVGTEQPVKTSADAPGLSLAGLIDFLSRKTKEPPLHWSAVSGPVSLEELQRVP